VATVVSAVGDTLGDALVRPGRVVVHLCVPRIVSTALTSRVARPALPR
jgi:hypothetical protein